MKIVGSRAKDCQADEHRDGKRSREQMASLVLGYLLNKGAEASGTLQESSPSEATDVQVQSSPSDKPISSVPSDVEFDLSDILRQLAIDTPNGPDYIRGLVKDMFKLLSNADLVSPGFDASAESFKKQHKKSVSEEIAVVAERMLNDADTMVNLISLRDGGEGEAAKSTDSPFPNLPNLTDDAYKIGDYNPLVELENLQSKMEQYSLSGNSSLPASSVESIRSSIHSLNHYLRHRGRDFGVSVFMFLTIVAMAKRSASCSPTVSEALLRSVESSNDAVIRAVTASSNTMAELAQRSIPPPDSDEDEAEMSASKSEMIRIADIVHKTEQRAKGHLRDVECLIPKLVPTREDLDAIRTEWEGFRTYEANKELKRLEAEAQEYREVVEGLRAIFEKRRVAMGKECSWEDMIKSVHDGSENLAKNSTDSGAGDVLRNVTGTLQMLTTYLKDVEEETLVLAYVSL